MIGVNDIYAGYGKIEILHGVSIDVEKGSITCLIGPNGSGKSTVFKSIFGIVRVGKGRVIFDGEDITNMKPHLVVRKGLSYIPQGKSIFRVLTVQENLEMGGVINNAEEVRDGIERVFQMFPILKEKRRMRATQLSGGEQQMLVIGRSLMLDPKTILVDEPSLGLEPKATKAVLNKLKEINENGTTLVIIEQNARRVLQISDFAYVIDLGKIRYYGTGKEIVENKEVEKLYLGAI